MSTCTCLVSQPTQIHVAIKAAIPRKPPGMPAAKAVVDTSPSSGWLLKTMLLSFPVVPVVSPFSERTEGGLASTEGSVVVVDSLCTSI